MITLEITMNEIETSRIRNDETLERYHALIESTNSMVWSVNIQDFGLVTFNSYMKQYYKEILHIDLVEGLTPEEMLPTQELVKYWLNNYKKVIESGPFRTEYGMKSSQHTLLISLYPMKVKDEVVGISVFTQDITEQKNAANYANDEYTKYKMLFDSVHDYVCVINADTYKIEHYNDHFKKTFIETSQIDLNNDSSFLKIVEYEAYQEWISMFEIVKEKGLLKTQINVFGNITIDLEMKLLELKNEGKSIFIYGEDKTSQIAYEKNLKDNFTRLMSQLQHSINAISKISEYKDPFTAGHQKRVQALSMKIAEAMNLDENVIRNISFGALIHDVGKLYIASDILNKPSELSDLEYQLVQTHVTNGYTIASEIDFPAEVTTMILQHHERLDGTGYPNQLSGSEIILESRILSVADVVEAMCAHRPYRPGHSIDNALNEIMQYRGIKFDEVVVDVCVELFRYKKFEFPNVHA